MGPFIEYPPHILIQSSGQPADRPTNKPKDHSIIHSREEYESMNVHGEEKFIIYKTKYIVG